MHPSIPSAIRAIVLGLVVALVLGLAPRAARAHGMRSAYLEITEIDRDHARVRLSAPSAGVAVPLPPGCTEDDEAASLRTFTCPGGLEGRELRVDGVGPVTSEVVLRIAFLDGSTVSRILTSDAPGWTIPRTSRPSALLLDYARLGVVHIFGGVDHLLFLVALAVSVRKVKALLVAETAFTASHSLTFTASALGWIHVAPAAAEACIALSLVLIALDAANASAGRGLVPARRAAGLAFAFGLVHGLGFAGGLTEIGLPARAVGWALVGFGGGVEVGQILFLALFAAALALVLRVQALRRAPLALAYAVGTAGAFLFLERGLP